VTRFPAAIDSAAQRYQRNYSWAYIRVTVAWRKRSTLQRESLLRYLPIDNVLHEKFTGDKGLTWRGLRLCNTREDIGLCRCEHVIARPSNTAAYGCLSNCKFFFFSLFHPRNYYKPSPCITISNTFDNLWKFCRAYAHAWRVLYKLQYGQIHKSWGNFLFNRIVLTSFMKLVASMLGCSSILPVYLWLSLLISSLTYGTLRWWCRMLLVTYQMILRYLSWNLCSISMF